MASPPSTFEALLESVPPPAETGSLLARWFDPCDGKDTAPCRARRAAFRKAALGRRFVAWSDPSAVSVGEYTEYKKRLHGRFSGDLADAPFTTGLVCTAPGKPAQCRLTCSGDLCQAGRTAPLLTDDFPDRVGPVEARTRRFDIKPLEPAQYRDLPNHELRVQAIVEVRGEYERFVRKGGLHLNGPGQRRVGLRVDIVGYRLVQLPAGIIRYSNPPSQETRASWPTPQQR